MRPLLDHKGFTDLVVSNHTPCSRGFSTHPINLSILKVYINEPVWLVVSIITELPVSRKRRNGGGEQLDFSRRVYIARKVSHG